MEHGTGRRILVAGGGSWGTALAHMLAGRGHSVRMLVRSPEVAENITLRHENAYLKGIRLSGGLGATTDVAELSTLSGEDILLLSIPAQQLRSWLKVARPYMLEGITVVNTAKGLEVGTLARCGEILAEEWGGLAPRYAALSGPSFALEVALGKPTAVVLACRDAELGRQVQAAFSSSRFRCYYSQDVTGVELGGALKNVMAIAAGICDGLNTGANSRAALLTRGLAELSRIGVACGADAMTFMGLSGIGDLILTCTGDLSRNRQVGLRLGHGEKLEDIVASLGMVAEGVKTTDAVCALGRQLHVEVPIADAVYKILHGHCSPQHEIGLLMDRQLKAE